MKSLTNSAGNKQWLDATKNWNLIAYLPGGTGNNFIAPLSATSQVFTKEDFESVLKKVSRPKEQSRFGQEK